MEPAVHIFINLFFLLMPLFIVVILNLFCLRIAREIAPRHKHDGSIITAPFLYLYFVIVYPITLMIIWFPAGLSLLLIYGEENATNLILPTSMNEQMLLFLLYIVLMSVIVSGFSLRAGELYRGMGIREHSTEPTSPSNYDLRIPSGMVV